MRYEERPEHATARAAFLALIPKAPRAIGKKELAKTSPLTEQWVDTFLAELQAAGAIALDVGKGWSRAV